MEDRRFNLIGFNFTNEPPHKQYRHCSIHVGTRLIEAEDPDMLLCPDCGIKYLVKDTTIDQVLKSDIPPTTQTKTKIITAKRKKKKYYDKQGNEINDESLIADMQRGATVISYKEEKSGKEEVRR